MTRDDIIRMAREAGLHIATDVNWMPIIGFEYAERFAELVAQHQREKDREQAVALLRQLHDNFSLESAELRIGKWAAKERA